MTAACLRNLASLRIGNAEEACGKGANLGELVAVERLRGCPQDVEWAIEPGIASLVQARPIRTLDHDGRLGLLSPLGDRPGVVA